MFAPLALFEVIYQEAVITLFFIRTYFLPFGRAASSARLAIQASYSGVPIRGGIPVGSPPSHCGTASIIWLRCCVDAQDTNAKHIPKEISLQTDFMVDGLILLPLLLNCRELTATPS